MRGPKIAMARRWPTSSTPALPGSLIRRRATEAVAAQADIIDVPAERADVRVAGEVKTDRYGLAGIARQVNQDLLIGAEPTIHPRRPAGERAARAFPDRAGVTAFADLRAEVFKV